jgi:hypothetical protein
MKDERPSRRFHAPVILSVAKDLEMRRPAPVASFSAAEILRRLRGSG